MADANQILTETEAKMKKAIESTKHDFSLVRTGRASAGLVEHIKVQHAECDSIGKPFRCALSGCDKSWKVSDEIGHDEHPLNSISVRCKKH